MAYYAGQRLKASQLGQGSHAAFFDGSATQTISNATNTVVAFGNDTRTSTYVVKSTDGAGHRFTLQASGIWAISADIRWSTSGASATGDKTAWIENSTSLWFSSSVIGAETDAPITNHLGVCTYFEEGDFVRCKVTQSSGGNEDLEANIFLGVPRIYLTLILKE